MRAKRMIGCGAAVMLAGMVCHGQSTRTPDSPPAAVNNPVSGRLDREEVFEFAARPAVAKQGDKTVITFASKAACDATVAIVGSDGRIVRHLASGVLGRNAPWPFKQNSLTQSLEWDGKDDFGQPAPAGCRVKVGLGLKATYERAIGFSPASFKARYGSLAPDVAGFIPAKDGVYVIGGSFQVRLFDRKGNYLRSLAPFPPNLALEKMKPVNFVKTADGESVPVDPLGIISRGQTIAAFLAMGRQTGCVLPDGRIGLIQSNNKRDNPNVFYLGQDGSIADDKAEAVKLGNTMQNFCRGFNLALSPDSKTVYVAGHNAVSVQKFPAGQAAKTELFAGDARECGTDEKHFRGSSGVATDKDGNILVSDYGNDRIQVFKPDGSFTRSIKVEGPEMLNINKVTGDIYVLSITKGSGTLFAKNKEKGIVGAEGSIWGAEYRLLKLSPDGTTKATFEIGKGDRIPVFAVDTFLTPPAVWIGNFDQESRHIQILSDNGAAFAKIPSPFDGINWDGIWSTVSDTRYGGLAADRKREEIYADKGIRRFDGRTGAHDASWEKSPKNVRRWATGFGGEFLVGGPESLIYVRSSGGALIARFDHDGKEVPFANGVALESCKVINFDQACGCSGLSGGFAVARNGDIYASSWGSICSLDSADKGKGLKDRIAAFRKAKPWMATNRGGDGGSRIKIWDRDGTLKNADALPAPGYPAGVRVDGQGNIYVVEPFQSPGQTGLSASAVTLFKFAPGHGLIRGDFAPEYKECKWECPSTPPTHSWCGVRIWAEDFLWDYPGVTTAGGPHNSCNCGDGRFDLDEFGRSFVPQTHLFSVRVLDANGNNVLRIGRYGNTDCQGAGSMFPNPDIGLTYPNMVAASDTAAYIADPGNSRIVKAALSYAVEETLEIK